MRVLLQIDPESIARLGQLAFAGRPANSLQVARSYALLSIDLA